MATVGTGSGHGAANRRKKIIFALPIGIMAKRTIGTGRCDRYCGGRGRPFGFPCRADGRTLTGGRLTAEAAEGVVTIRNNRLSQEVLRGISAAPLLPD